MAQIHPTALVSSSAQLDDTVVVEAHAIIGDQVSIGPRTRIMARAWIGGYTTLGADNVVHMGAVIGHEPQDFAFDPAVRSYVQIGDGNVIREYATIHRGTHPETVTAIGNHNFLMVGVHVGHNCSIGDHTVIVNNALLGGHVQIGDRAFVSGGVVLHQFCRVGRLAMVSGNARVSMDVPPFVNALERNQVQGLNLVGLKRAGVTREALRELKHAYRILFQERLHRREAHEQLAAAGFVSAEAQEFVAFVRSATRPLVQPRER